MNLQYKSDVSFVDSLTPSEEEIFLTKINILENYYKIFKRALVLDYRRQFFELKEMLDPRVYLNLNKDYMPNGIICSFCIELNSKIEECKTLEEDKTDLGKKLLNIINEINLIDFSNNVVKREEIKTYYGRLIFAALNLMSPENFIKEITTDLIKNTFENDSSLKELIFSRLNRIILSYNLSESSIENILKIQSYRDIALIVLNNNISIEKRKSCIKKAFKQKDMNLFLDHITFSLSTEKNADLLKSLDIFMEVTIIENARIKEKYEKIYKILDKIIYLNSNFLLCENDIYSIKTRIPGIKEFFNKYKSYIIERFENTLSNSYNLRLLSFSLMDETEEERYRKSLKIIRNTIKKTDLFITEYTNEFFLFFNLRDNEKEFENNFSIFLDAILEDKETINISYIIKLIATSKISGYYKNIIKKNLETILKCLFTRIPILNGESSLLFSYLSSSQKSIADSWLYNSLVSTICDNLSSIKVYNLEDYKKLFLEDVDDTIVEDKLNKKEFNNKYMFLKYVLMNLSYNLSSLNTIMGIYKDNMSAKTYELFIKPFSENPGLFKASIIKLLEFEKYLGNSYYLKNIYNSKYEVDNVFIVLNDFISNLMEINVEEYKDEIENFHKEVSESGEFIKLIRAI